LDPIALGVGLGIVCGLLVFGATVALLLKGGPLVGPRLALLGQYFIGYRVTPSGSLVGLVYGSLTGFVFGWTIATLRNGALNAYLRYLRLRAQLSHWHDVTDPF
jgi:hypothetical protein